MAGSGSPTFGVYKYPSAFNSGFSPALILVEREAKRSWGRKRIITK